MSQSEETTSLGKLLDEHFGEIISQTADAISFRLGISFGFPSILAAVKESHEYRAARTAIENFVVALRYESDEDAVVLDRAGKSLSKLQGEVAALREDKERLDWLDDLTNFYMVTPATNMVGVPKGWTHRVGRPLESIGERFLDLREAIDAARAERKVSE